MQNNFSIKIIIVCIYLPNTLESFPIPLLALLFQKVFQNIWHKPNYVIVILSDNNYNRLGDNDVLLKIKRYIPSQLHLLP